MKTRNHVLILTNVLLIMEDVHSCVSMNLEVTNVNVKEGFIQQILSEYCTLEIFVLSIGRYDGTYFRRSDDKISRREDCIYPLDTNINNL